MSRLFATIFSRSRLKPLSSFSLSSSISVPYSSVMSAVALSFMSLSRLATVYSSRVLMPKISAAVSAQ